jgi:hypothetical protein
MPRKRPAGKLNQSDAAIAYRLKASVKSLRDNKAKSQKRDKEIKLLVAKLNILLAYESTQDLNGSLLVGPKTRVEVFETLGSLEALMV